MRISMLGAALVAVLLSACGATAPGDEGLAGVDTSSEPALETDQAVLDAALQCTPFTHPDQPPVLLVHGTFTSGYEQYDWTYLPLLADRGFDVCTVTYPDRGFGDQQISAEYIVNALRHIHAETGRKVAMIGHSQGASMPRWALKWWPSARDALADFVLEAGPNHGTTQVSSLTGLLPASLPIGLFPEAFYQFAPDSQFTTVVNSGDETPGDVDYTNLYTQFDELVQPAAPVPTAALDWQQDNPHVANILLQDVCPGRIVDHVTIGLTDRLAFELAVDAITHDGPASVDRVREAAGGQTALCGMLPIVPDQIISPQIVSGLIATLRQEGANSIPALHLASGEPPLKPYAQ